MALLTSFHICPTVSSVRGCEHETADIGFDNLPKMGINTSKKRKYLVTSPLSNKQSRNPF